MKLKHKQLPSPAYHLQVNNDYSCHKQIHRKKSSTRNYAPLSIKPLKNNHEFQSNAYEFSIKSSQFSKIKSSPYIELPSLPNQNNENMNSSNQSQNMYLQQPQQHSSTSLYDKLQLNTHHKKQFFTDETDEISHYADEMEKDKPVNTKRKNSSNNIGNDPYKSKYLKQTNSRSQCHHLKSPEFIKHTENPILQYNLSQIDYSQTKYKTLSNLNDCRELIKRQINQKLDRVCSKIDCLSKEKYKNINQIRQESMKNKIQWNNQNQAIKSVQASSPNLCYSSIVYQQRPQQYDSISYGSFTPNQTNSYSNQFYQKQVEEDNKIQRRITSPQKSSHQQLLQDRIIEMDKKITFANSKILKLEEDLIQQKQKLIRKQKEWLVRQNELLKWIQENQIEQDDIKASSVESPNRSKHSLSKSYAAANNVIIDTKSLQLRQELQFYKDLSVDLKEFQNSVISLLKLNESWLGLMNRTLSEELPGTAFRVKQQMNLNHQLFKEIQNKCSKKAIFLSSMQSKVCSIPKQNRIISFLTTPQQQSKSEIFLLESYCPATQVYEISTKRNHQSFKQSNKSLLCASESRSTTNKKNNIISTHKKGFQSKQKDQQKRLTNSIKKPKRPIDRSHYRSRQSELYCDEVFYDKDVQERKQIDLNGQMKEKQSSNELYYMLSLQAIVLESFILNQSHPIISNMKQDQDLLYDSS